jgi:hypothetical protein
MAAYGRLAAVLGFIFFSPNGSPIELLMMKIRTKV